MNRTHFYPVFLLVLFLLGCAGTEQQVKPDKAASKPTPSKTKEYTDLMKFQGDGSRHLLDDRILILSWFPSWDRKNHMICVVGPAGKAFIYKSIYSMNNNTVPEELSPEENTFSQIKEALDQLGDPEVPAIKNPAYIFSCRRIADWKTYEFDRKNLPEEILRIYKLLKLDKLKKE